MSRKSIIALSLLIGCTAAHAEIKLPSYVTDNMVVQQNSVFRIKGTAAPKSKVSVQPGWSHKPVTAVADAEGKFVAEIQTPQAGGPYTIKFTDAEGSRTLENVLSGEVWLCSGQSNMEFPVQGWGTAMDYDHVIPTAQHPDIRLLQVKKTIAHAPQSDVVVNGGGWQICNSASVADFSAIAYFFACELVRELKVPVGVIDTTWGGTPAEAWTSHESLASIPGFENELADLEAAGYDSQRLYDLYNRRVEDWFKAANSSDVDFDRSVMQKGGDWKKMTAPGYWEVSALPGFDGIVWLQHEVDIPADMAGQMLMLKFSAIDDEDETYFNGKLVGKGAGYNTPRSYAVQGTDVKPGKNVITVKVTDFGGEGGIAPGPASVVNAVTGKAVSLEGDWNLLVANDFSKMPPRPMQPTSSSYPSVLYNAMLAPLGDMPVQGVLWYQGCNNVGRDAQYEPLFQALINDWRKLWRKDMPFYFVQLAGYLQPQAVQPESQWAALRNAQAKALKLENTGMATAIDLGHPTDIHPRNKQDVAHRLALIALNRTYGRDNVYSGPVCVSVNPEGSSLVLKFDSPVVPTTVAPTGFIIAGDDNVFTTATPVLVDDCTVRISAPGIDAPRYVRYNWADYPCGNLYGTTGLPVAPFANDK